MPSFQLTVNDRGRAVDAERAAWIRRLPLGPESFR
jgi:hypothetical protein